MTKKEAIALFDKWVRILELESWDIRLYWNTRSNDMPISDAQGCCSWVDGGRHVIINMLDPEYDTCTDFPFDYKKTLVHELMHLKLSPLSSSDPIADRVHHRLVDDIAYALVKAEREGKSKC